MVSAGNRMCQAMTQANCRRDRIERVQRHAPMPRRAQAMKPTRFFTSSITGRGDGARLLRAGFENAVDLRRIGQQPAHFLGHRLQLGHGQLGQRVLEAGELLAGELGDHRVRGPGRPARHRC